MNPMKSYEAVTFISLAIQSLQILGSKSSLRSVSSTNVFFLWFFFHQTSSPFLPILCWSSQTHGSRWQICLTSLSFLLLLPDLALCSFLSNPFWHSINPHCPDPYLVEKPLITVAMPVCPRSVSCHPMGSMSFKALQAQPLPHCRSHDRNLCKETASSSSKTARRRTTGATQVGDVIDLQLFTCQTYYIYDKLFFVKGF